MARDLEVLSDLCSEQKKEQDMALPPLQPRGEPRRPCTVRSNLQTQLPTCLGTSCLVSAAPCTNIRGPIVPSSLVTHDLEDSPVPALARVPAHAVLLGPQSPHPLLTQPLPSTSLQMSPTQRSGGLH